MIIHSDLTYAGKKYDLEYRDCDTFDSLPYASCKQIYCVCFLDDNIVLVHNRLKDTWGLVGGSIEKDEAFATTITREVQEESNMHVICWHPIGYQKVTDRNGRIIYQLRAYAKVEKIAAFSHDPGGDIDQVMLINPHDYKQYFDWKEIGDRIIIRAMEIHKRT